MKKADGGIDGRMGENRDGGRNRGMKKLKKEEMEEEAVDG